MTEKRRELIEGTVILLLFMFIVGLGIYLSWKQSQRDPVDDCRQLCMSRGAATWEYRDGGWEAHCVCSGDTNQ